MPSSIRQAFEEYKSNLEITDRQESVVAARRESVVEVLDDELLLHSSKSKVTGSWARNTLTRHLFEADVDVMVILDYEVYSHWHDAEGTIKALDRFRTVLDEAYHDTSKRRDRNCITMRFSEFKLDVVPAFLYNDGTYAIPDAVDKVWRRTDPFGFAKKITDVNKQLSDTFVPLIKMVKGWNREVGWPIRSFHLENLMYQRFHTWTTLNSYPFLLQDFFQALPGLLATACYEPVTWDRVDTYLDNGASKSAREIAIAKAGAAAEGSKEAYDDQDRFPYVAMSEWKNLFGEF